MYMGVCCRYMIFLISALVVGFLFVPLVFGVILALTGVGNYERFGFSFSDVDEGIFGRVSIIGGTALTDVTGDELNVLAYDSVISISCGWPIPLFRLTMSIDEISYRQTGKSRVVVHAGNTKDLNIHMMAAGAWGIIVAALLAFGSWRCTARFAAIQCCTRCGYDLTGVPGPRCPECGE